MAFLGIPDSLVAGIAEGLHTLFKLKAAIWLARLLSAVGLGFAAQALVYDPLIQYAQDAWNSIPLGVANWVHALGIDTAVSIILSAYGIKGAERIFLRRNNQS